LTSEETYTKGGKFGADQMYQLLQGALADAKSRGHRVRTSGVMDWATRGRAANAGRVFGITDRGYRL
jgi:hypothetical protein